MAEFTLHTTDRTIGLEEYLDMLKKRSNQEVILKYLKFPNKDQVIKDPLEVFIGVLTSANWGCQRSGKYCTINTSDGSKIITFLEKPNIYEIDFYIADKKEYLFPSDGKSYFRMRKMEWDDILQYMKK